MGRIKPDDARRKLAGSYLLVGGADFRLRNPSSTLDYYLKAVQLRQEMAAAHPDVLDWRQELGFARQRLGDFYLRTQQPDLAGKEYDAAARVYQELVARDPKRDDYQNDLARAYYDVATAALLRGEKTLAAEKYRASLEIREARARGRAEAAVQKDLMITLARCGEIRRAAAIAERISKECAGDPGSLTDVACCLATCSAMVAAGKPADTLTAQERSLREQYANQALEALRQAVAQGYRNVVNLETEPDLDALRDQPGFKSLLAELTRLEAK